MHTLHAFSLTRYEICRGLKSDLLTALKDTLYSNEGTQVYLNSYIEVRSAHAKPLPYALKLSNREALTLFLGERARLSSKGTRSRARVRDA